MLDDPVPKGDVVAHPPAAEVQVTVLKAQKLVHRPFAVDLERRRRALVEDAELGGEHLDLPGREIRVLVAPGPPRHLALDGDAPLGPQLLGIAEHLARVRVEGNLGYAPAVPQVYEDEPAVVAAPAHPARQPHALAEVLRPQLARRPRPVRVPVGMQSSTSAVLMVGRVRVYKYTRRRYRGSYDSSPILGAELHFERLVARFLPL